MRAGRQITTIFITGVAGDGKVTNMEQISITLAIKSELLRLGIIIKEKWPFITPTTTIVYVNEKRRVLVPRAGGRQMAFHLVEVEDGEIKIYANYYMPQDCLYIHLPREGET